MCEELLFVPVMFFPYMRSLFFFIRSLHFPCHHSTHSPITPGIHLSPNVGSDWPLLGILLLAQGSPITYIKSLYTQDSALGLVLSSFLFHICLFVCLFTLHPLLFPHSHPPSHFPHVPFPAPQIRGASSLLTQTSTSSHIMT